MKKCTVIILALMFCAGASWAAVINAPNAIRKLVPTQWADGYLRHGSTPTQQGSTSGLRGYYDSATKMNTPVLVFVLPDLGGESIASANLSVFGTRRNANDAYNGGLDLYGVRYAPATATTSDTELMASDEAFSAAYSVSGNNGTGIMQGFFPLSTTTAVDGTYETDGTADIVLGAWLQSLYDAGAVAGDYVFLRLTPNTVPTSVFGRGWQVMPADAATDQPVLTIETGTVPLTALFSANPTAGYAPMEVTFTDTSIGTITNRAWDFGDGATTNTTATEVTHTYTAAGTNTVQLIVSGPDGESTNIMADAITVITAVAPTADFSANKLSGYAPLEVTFADASAGMITNRIWNFGDGTITNTTATTVQHTYITAGTYDVELVVSGSAGSDANLQSSLISVTDLPAGSFIAPNAIRESTPTQWADGYLRTGSTPTQQGSTTGLRAYHNTTTNLNTPILVFVLPDLAGSTIASANLSAFGARNQPSDEHNEGVDLYGVRYAPATAATSDTELLASDEAFSATYSVSGNNGTGIMQGFFPLSTTTAVDGTYETDGAADIALGAWLQSQYDAGAQAGDYVFLRLSPNTVPTTVFNRGWGVTPADADENQPLLMIQTESGPPPASVVTLVAAGNGQDIINWTTVQGFGYVYSVYYSINLNAGFLPLQTNLADTVHSLTNTIDASPVFYKIEAQ